MNVDERERRRKKGKKKDREGAWLRGEGANRGRSEEASDWGLFLFFLFQIFKWEKFPLPSKGHSFYSC